MDARQPVALRILFPLALALLGLASSPARGAIDPRALEVVERYLEAMGGRDAWQAEQTLHSRDSVSAFGFRGVSESWSARPDRAASRTALGPFVLREGTDGRRAWRIDQNGKLQWLEGRELEQSRSAAYFENERWLSADQGGGSVRYAGEEAPSGDPMDVLEIAPPGGKPRRLYFDSATGLLARITQRAESREIVVVLSGYERIGGRLRPRSSLTSVEGMPANTLTARLDSLWTNETLDSSVFLPPRAESRDFRFLGGSRAARVPMRYQERHVWVKASLNGGSPEDFLLDTGASVTALDSSYAAKHGLAVEGELEGGGAGGQGKFHFARLRSLRVEGQEGQGVELQGQTVAILALNRDIAPYFWREAAGILGYDFISRFVTTVDFEHQTLALAEPDGFVYMGNATPVPMSFAGGVPVVRGRVNGLEGEFRLDVGSSSGVDLHAPFVRRNDLVAKVGGTVPIVAGGFGGTFPMLACRFDTFVLGPFTLRGPLGSLSQATIGAYASEDYAGNVGNRVLDRFTCIFDYARKRLYLEPNARFAERDAGDKAGLFLARAGDGLAVAYVVPGSPAHEAGVRPGDIVKAVAKRPVSTYTQDELHDLFERSPDGARVPVEVVRAGKTHRLKMKLRTLL